MKKQSLKILGLNFKSSQSDIRKAYKKLAFKWHPDKNINKNVKEREIAKNNFNKIKNAYTYLSELNELKKSPNPHPTNKNNDLNNEKLSEEESFIQFMKNFTCENISEMPKPEKKQYVTNIQSQIIEKKNYRVKIPLIDIWENKEKKIKI